MQDFWTDLGFSVVITALRGAIKNAASRKKLTAVFKKIYDLILIAYPEFAQPEE
jgi:hypothetical protein